MFYNYYIWPSFFLKAMSLTQKVIFLIVNSMLGVFPSPTCGCSLKLDFLVLREREERQQRLHVDCRHFLLFLCTVKHPLCNIILVLMALCLI